MSLRASVQINDITPAGSSHYLLELVISAWELHQEMEWTLFSWYGDLHLNATGLQIQEIIPASAYDNEYFNAELAEDRTNISGLGFTGNPFASKNSDLFHFGTILVSLSHLPSDEHPLTIALGPVQSAFNQAETISLQTVAASKQLFPGVAPSPSHNLANEIGRIQESVAFNSDQLTTGIFLLSRYNRPPSLAVTELILPGAEDTIQLITIGNLLNDLGASDPEQEEEALKVLAVHTDQLEIQGNNTWRPLTAGTILDNPEAIIRWTPPTDQAGTLKLFTAGAWDGESTSTQEALISINLTPIDDRSVISGDTTGSGHEDTIITGTLVATDVEGLNDGSVFSITTGNGPANGTASIDRGTGAWSYTPNANFNGTDSFSVTITDDLGGTTPQVISITVNPIDDAAVVTGDTAGSGNEDPTTPITGTLVATDVEGLNDGSVFSITTGNGPANGTASIDRGTGAWSYTPNANFNGTDSFSVTITDDLGGTTEQTISLTVLKNPDTNSTQYITFASPETINYTAGNAVAIQLALRTGEREVNLGGTTLNIHYDSTILTPAALSNGASILIGGDSSSASLADDIDNLDGDDDTDKIIQLNWGSDQTAPSVNGEQSAIATLNFTASRRLIDPVSGQILTTSLNLSSPDSAVSHDPQRASLDLQPDFSYDVDGDGFVSAASDGLLILQKLFGTGLPDDTIINGAASINGSRSTASEIQNWLELGIEGDAFDVNRDDQTSALSDGMMIMRHLTGLSTGSESIDSFISNFMP